MPRDLVTVSQLIRETQTDLENATTAVDNARDAFERAKDNQAKLIERFDALWAEHTEAVHTAKAKGLRHQGQQEPEPTPNVFDAGLDALNTAFDRATNPQGGSGNGVAF